MTASLDWVEHAARSFEPGGTTRIAQWDTPGDLARAVNPHTVQTPALDLIDRELVQAWNTPDARLIISMPPQEGKSERVTKTGNLWALTRNPDTRIAIASYAQSLAEGFGREIRNWITTNNGDDDTLDLGLAIARDNGAARRWQLSGHRGGVICVGIGSGFTGRPADALVIDDPFADAEQADSEYYRDRVWEWWQAVSGPRLAPGAPVIVILTRWHEDDLAGRLQAAEDGHVWRVLNIPAQADHKPDEGQTDPLGREPGQWLQSARRRSREQWEAIRIRSGSRVFNALYQGHPSPDSGNVWKRPWWRRYRTMLWTQHPNDPAAYLVHDMDEVIQSWDMTFKDTKGSDFVSATVWARRGAEVFLLDKIHKRLTFTDTLAAFRALTAKWPQATAKLVEDKANGTAVINMLQSEIGGIVPVNPTESKYARANAVSPFIEAGNVYLPDDEIALPGVDVDSLIDEAAAFPNAAHDDEVDSTSQALARLLLDGTGAQAWMEYLKRLAAGEPAPGNQPAAPPAVEPAAEPDPDDGLSPLQRARNEAFRANYR
ncbi:MAG TPA: phage terminase large subunit [Jatrophihabitantaceae bacterium]|jgi:predicted phage terminase large subunit-like protein